MTIRFESYAAYDVAEVGCRHCGGSKLVEIIGRVAIAKSEEARMDALADPSAMGDLDENDPKSMGRWMRKMGREMGEDMGPEFDEVIGRLEAGEDPESIEQTMPDLGGDMGGMDAF
ncbi:MAG: zinc ribbon domain-containing protein [Ardenticatenales bacterium]|nr:zinc ribbon domain-containing protein [Ardenticatenales bacterium]